MPQKYAKLPWSKSFRKLPADVETTLVSLGPAASCVVGCAKAIQVVEINRGDYGHLNIWSTDDLSCDFQVLIPSPNVGRASFANATPIDEPDRSRGKFSKLLHGRAPTPGRFRTHATTYRRDVWHRRFIAPAMTHIAFRRILDGMLPDRVNIHFQVQEVITTDAVDCRSKILRCANLLQENVGKIGLFPADSAEAESMRRLSEDIGWTILPEPNHETALEPLLRRLNRSEPGRVRVVQDRFDFILSLKPRRILHGSRGFSGYFVVEFADNLSVFENLEIDHAMYVVRGPAAELSHLSRSALFERFGQDVERIVHSAVWKQRLNALVRAARGDHGPDSGDLV